MAGLASRLAARGHQITLITLDDAQNDRHMVDASVTRQPLAVMKESQGFIDSIRNTSWRLQKIRREVVRQNSDVVLTFCDRTNVLTLLALIGTKIRTVASERSDPAQQTLGGQWEFLRRLAYPRARRLIALTETSARHLQRYSRQRVAVIPSAVEQPPRSSDRTVASKTNRVIGIGRLEHEKGFDRLIRAFAAGRHGDTNWTLQILGEGSQRRALEELAAQLGVATSVSLPGWKHPVWPELETATCFVLPSRYEGFPSALLEAMAVGLPCIAVDCESGPRAIITNRQDGLLVEPSIAGIAGGLDYFAAEPQRREELGCRAKDVTVRFGWEAMVDAYEELLTEVAKR